MTNFSADTRIELTQSQERAVSWNDGPLLVIAGPGAGKTRILTNRVARIINETPKEHFRLLALTFTNKAGDEMRHRVEAMAPNGTERAFIGTFHSFCSQKLRQHGSHIGIRSDFGIYADERDREELLREALARAEREGKSVSAEDVDMLHQIDTCFGHLLEPCSVLNSDLKLAEKDRLVQVYEIYESALHENNVLDFNSIIYYTWKLARKTKSFAKRIQQAYRYWLIDDFQDISFAQFALLNSLSGDMFRNIFVLADDDQIIYEWAGASSRRISQFRERYEPEEIHLTENHRCPSEIVAFANQLISHNAGRTRRQVGVSRDHSVSVELAPHSVKVEAFANDLQEAEGIEKFFRVRTASECQNSVILGRNRKILRTILAAFRDAGAPAVIIENRQTFVSPQFRWLQSCLELAQRPHDRRRFRTLAASAGRFLATDFDSERFLAEADVSMHGYLEAWALWIEDSSDPVAQTLAGLARQLVGSRNQWKEIVGEAVQVLSSLEKRGDGTVGDVEEDAEAWATISQEIETESGSGLSLETFVQGVALRPRVTSVEPGAVRLMTIQGAKGLEFDTVWVAGLADDILPSYQSLEAGGASLDEERRHLFVAITRTKRQLILSYPKAEGEWGRKRSRFLREMFGSST